MDQVEGYGPEVRGDHDKNLIQSTTLLPLTPVQLSYDPLSVPQRLWRKQLCEKTRFRRKQF